METTEAVVNRLSQNVVPSRNILLDDTDCHVDSQRQPSLLLLVMLCCLQVRPNYRTAITIPERFWGRFRDIISDFIEETSAQPEVSDKPVEDKEVVKEEVAEDTAAGASSEAASGNWNCDFVAWGDQTDDPVIRECERYGVKLTFKKRVCCWSIEKLFALY